MEKVRGRIHITANDLEQVARCPHSINFLSRVRHSRYCPRCYIFSETARFVMQRNFRGGKLPSSDGIIKHYNKLASKLGLPEADSKDKVMLHDLLIWGKGIADQINMVGVAAESHFGNITITDIIDAIIYDMDKYTIVQVVCDQPHQERIMHYKTFHASLWLRKTYQVEENNIMLVKMTGEGVQLHRFPIEIPENILQDSIEHILSVVDTGVFTEKSDNIELLNLPTIYGEHCWHCQACFPGGAHGNNFIRNKQR